MNYSINVMRDPSSFQSVRYNVSREGNNISIVDTSAEGRRHRGDDYDLVVGADSVSIRSANHNWDIQMSPEGVSVSDPNSVGRRGRGTPAPVDGFASQSPLKPEQYEQAGLSIASSLIGIPLFFPQA